MSNGLIAFSTHFVLPFGDRGVGAQIFTVSPSGSGPHQLTHVSSHQDAAAPAVSIVNACAGMIRIDKESDVVGLVHKTTQEYFEKNGINHFPHAHRDITTSCLRYLSLHVFSSGYCPSDELFKRRLTKNALLDYAVRSLGDHISRGFDCSLKDLALKVFLDERTTSSASQV